MENEDIALAVKNFQRGLPVCVFDSEYREGETDLLFLAKFVTPENIRQLRQDCGGLLFLAIGSEIGKIFDLPYLQDLHSQPDSLEKYPVLNHLVTNDLQYDNRSAFTLSLNHRNTFTGITDKDRALTTKRFAELSEELISQGKNVNESIESLGAEFRTPGHIPVCLESEGGLSSREGHTELAVGLARLCDEIAVVIGAEMLEPNGDKALDFESAKKWASERNIPFLSGSLLKNALID